jgi:hypothetical protein
MLLQQRTGILSAELLQALGNQVRQGVYDAPQRAIKASQQSQCQLLLLLLLSVTSHWSPGIMHPIAKPQNVALLICEAPEA